MSKQTWTWIVLVIVVLGIIWLVMGRGDGAVETGEGDDVATSTEETNSNNSGSNSSNTTGSNTSVNTGSNVAVKPLVYQIKYLESGGYLPQTTKVKVGDIVSFQNVGSNQMWTISADYPGAGTNNCGTASEYVIFDQCRVGTSYSFTMGVRGVWTYYNKMLPNHKGTIIVE